MPAEDPVIPATALTYEGELPPYRARLRHCGPQKVQARGLATRAATFALLGHKKKLVGAWPSVRWPRRSVTLRITSYPTWHAVRFLNPLAKRQFLI